MHERKFRIKFWTNVAAVTLIVIACFIFLRLDPVRLLTVTPSFVGYIANNFLPPSLTHVRVYAHAVVGTIAFAVVGTYISAILSFVFALMMSEAIMPYWPVRVITRFVMTFLRNIPVIIWVTLLVFIFGIGSMVGLIALVLAATGFLSRSYAESINEIATKKLEPLRASGVPTIRLIQHGLLPEFAPNWVNWTLFSFEINIRASAILGMVGAGGMGVLIQTNLNLRNFNEVATLVLMLIIIVLCTEFAAGIIRKKILNGSEKPVKPPGWAAAIISRFTAHHTPTPVPRSTRIYRLFFTLAAVAVFTISLAYMNLDMARFVSRLGNFPRIMGLLMQVNPAIIIPGLRQFMVSFAMGVVGLVLGGIIAFALAFLAADNIAPCRILSFFIKAIVSVIRAVPSLVIILMIVAAIGFGYTTGVVGLTLSSVGYLTKAFIASIEEQGVSKVTAMRTTGASWGQIVVHGLVPSVVTGFIAWIAIRLETSVAESISLGVVGAGGIGTLLSRAIRGFDYGSITVLILIIFVCMFCLELMATWLRRRV